MKSGNLLLHGIDVPNQVEHANTLASGWNDWQLNERVDCVVTNPPFGGLEDAGAGADYPSAVRTRETADMSLTLIVKKTDAEARAKPHWDEAESLRNQAADLDARIRHLRDTVKGTTDAAKRNQTTAKIESLKSQTEQLQTRARDAQAAGDRIYWPIFNLDIPNPNAPEPESHDPDELLAKYKTLLADIAETRTQLRDQLAAALQGANQ